MLRTLCRAAKLIGLLALSLCLAVSSALAVNSDDLVDQLDEGYQALELADAFAYFSQFLELPNGQIVMAGRFIYIDGERTTNLARLNSDGSIDTSFRANVQVNDLSFQGIRALARQADGKIVIGGSIVSVSGQARLGIARLNSDGSLDASFAPILRGLNDSTVGIEATNIAVQVDGKILITGSFRSVNGLARAGLARLNSDGSVDMSFAAVDPGASSVNSLAIQSDGKILLGGSEFMAVGGESRPLARINTDGSADMTYTPVVTRAAAPSVSSIALQSDGKAIIGGFFDSVNMVTRNHIARLNTDGSLDASYDPNINNTVFTLSVATSGACAVVGQFSQVRGENIRSFAVVNSDGSLDTNFGSTNYFGVRTAAALSDGGFLIAGDSVLPNFLDNYQVIKEDANGDYDTDFFVGLVEDEGGYLRNIVAYGDGALIIGEFTRANGVPRKTIALLDEFGRVDRNFQSTPDSSYFDAAITADNKIVVVGNFSTVDGNSAFRLARLNMDGSFDDEFTPSGVTSFPVMVEILTNGQIIVAGGSISRHNTDGTLDNGFSASTNPNGFIETVAEQPDGKLVIGGGFTQVNGVAREYLARLELNGDLDGSFLPVVATGSGSTPAVSNIILEADGDILFSGLFGEVNNITKSNIARVSSSGVLDDSFNLDYQRGIADLLRLDDNHYLLAGVTRIVSDTDIPSVLLVDTDGVIDESFNPRFLDVVEGPSGSDRLAIDSNGGLLVGGPFSFAHGKPRKNLIRLGIALPVEESCFVIPISAGGAVSFCL